MERVNLGILSHANIYCDAVRHFDDPARGQRAADQFKGRWNQYYN